jgi:hypothetical protein
MIQLLQLTIDVAALILLGAALFALGVAVGLESVKSDARRLRASIDDLIAAHDEFAAKAIETIEFQRETIAMLTAPETYEFDGRDKFN